MAVYADVSRVACAARTSARSVRRRATVVSFCAVAVAFMATPAYAVFHVAHFSEVMTGYSGDDNVQFVEIVMEQLGQNLTTGTKLNAFDAQGNFLATVLTVPGNVESGKNRAWIMGTPAFETASGLQVDFEFANGALPAAGGMICWGAPGDAPTPISCPEEGSPYVDCLAYGSYSGPTNECVGDPNPVAPQGHSLRRVTDTHDNATDFECADPADPKNNANETISLPATSPCPGATTTTTTVIITTTTQRHPTTIPSTTTSVTTTTLPGELCGDATGEGSITASDALVALRTAVGSASCPATVCDVDNNGAIVAADALRILRRAVGQNVELTCPSA